MSKKDQVANRNYADEIGLESVPMSVARLVALLCWYDRHVPMFISVSGIGKTAVMKTLSRANDMDCVIFSLAHCEPSDITGPMWPAGDDSYTHLRNKRIPIDDEETPVILFFDEPNRADMPTLNAVFPAWSERRLGGHALGRNVVVAAAMNPPGGDYAVTSQFSSDPAMRRRTCQICVHFSREEFMRWAENPTKVNEILEAFPKIRFEDDYEESRRDRPLHMSIIEFLQGSPDLALDEKSRESGKVYACPATWEQVSDTLYTVDRLKLDTGSALIQRVLITKFAGHLGYKVASDVFDYYVKSSTVIDPRDALINYKDGTQVWKKVQRLIRGGDHGQLMGLVNLLANVWATDESLKLEDMVDPMAQLMYDFPPQVSGTFLATLAEADHKHNGGMSDRAVDMGQLLTDHPTFKKFRERRAEASEETTAKARELTSKAS
jgi:MoxR-like ATPase